MSNRSDFHVDCWSREEWAELTSSFPTKNIYQVWDYAELHSAGSHRSVYRCALMRGTTPVAMAQMRVKSLPLVSASVAELEWGPMFLHLEDLRSFLNHLKDDAVGGRGWEVRVHPRSTYLDSGDREIRSVLEDTGYRFDPTERPYQTVVLHLEPDLDFLHKELHGSWRRHLRKAESSGLVLEEGRTLDYFDRFMNVYEEMWGSKQFLTGVRHPIIRGMMDSLSGSERFSITIAMLEGRDVGASVSAAMGDTLLYFLGASTPGLRENCRPGYLLHWNNVGVAKEMGMDWYDLGGIVDTGEGVNQFKRGMGGREIVFPGCFAAGADRYSSKFYHLVEDSFRTIRTRLTGR